MIHFKECMDYLDIDQVGIILGGINFILAFTYEKIKIKKRRLALYFFVPFFLACIAYIIGELPIHLATIDEVLFWAPFCIAFWTFQGLVGNFLETIISYVIKKIMKKRERKQTIL